MQQRSESIEEQGEPPGPGLCSGEAENTEGEDNKLSFYHWRPERKRLNAQSGVGEPQVEDFEISDDNFENKDEMQEDESDNG